MRSTFNRIVLDAGHGGKDSGAVGPTGLRECDVNLALAIRAKGKLVSLGFDVLMTREYDEFVELDERTHLANSWLADLFVSLHCNSVGSPVPSGYEVWTSPGQTKADRFADILFQEIRTRFPREQGRADQQDGDLDREKHLYVLDHTQAPAALGEFGFISHPGTESEMRTDAWLDAMAVAVSSAVCSYRA